MMKVCEEREQSAGTTVYIASLSIGIRGLSVNAPLWILKKVVTDFLFCVTFLQEAQGRLQPPLWRASLSKAITLKP